MQRGDVVALLLPTTPLYLVAYLGAARLGAITTGINVRYRRTEIAHVLARAGARYLLAVDRWHDADFRSTVEPLRPDPPELRDVVWLAADRLRATTAGAVADLGPPVGGTATGAPKGAWHMHRSLLALVEIERRRYAGGIPERKKHLAAGVSFAHVGTMTRVGVQIAHLGASLVHDAFDAAAVLQTIERERLAHLGGIPTQVVMLQDHSDRPRRDLSSLRSVLIGRAPAAPELIRRVRDEFAVEVSVRYSSTEVGIR